jgi:hypothetical protein
MSDHDYLTTNADLNDGDTLEVINHPQYGQVTNAYLGERFGVLKIPSGREHVEVVPLDPASQRAGRGPELFHVNWFRKVENPMEPAPPRPPQGPWLPGDTIVSLSTRKVFVLNKTGTQWSDIGRRDVQQWANEAEEAARERPHDWRVLIKGGEIVGA